MQGAASGYRVAAPADARPGPESRAAAGLHTVHVRDVPVSATERDVAAAFEACGPVADGRDEAEESRRLERTLAKGALGFKAEADGGALAGAPRWLARFAAYCASFVEEETEALASARGVYAKENEVVYFEKVPEKPAWRVPEGKVIVAEIAYERG